MDKVEGRNVVRKTVAILAADVVGFSSVAEADELVAVTALHTLRERVMLPTAGRHKGRLFKEVGDGFMVEFASASDAVNAAVAIQIGLLDDPIQIGATDILSLRIGLNAGDVIVQGSDLLGDAVNIASRVQTLASPGGICLTAAVYEQVAHRVSLPYRSMGVRRLRNISRAIPLYEIEASDLKGGEPKRPAAAAEANPPRIAVLPLVNIGGGDELQHLCDGIASGIATALSRFHSVRVLSPSSTFSFRDHSERVVELVRALRADFVLEGTLLAASQRVRLEFHLIEGEGGEQAWAETFDRERADLLGLEDDLTERIVGLLENRVVQSRLRRIERTAGHTEAAYDCWLRGEHLLSSWTPEADEEALKWFEQAIDRDPSFARAHASAAAVLNTRILLRPGNPSDAEDRARAMDHARRALELDDRDARNHVNCAWGLMLARDFARAGRHFALAEQLNPHAADILIACGLGSAYLGDPLRAKRLASRATSLNPFHSDYYLANQTMIFCLAGDYSDAIETGQQVREVLPELPGWLAASYALGGRIPEARQEAARFVELVSRRWAGTEPPSAERAVAWFLAVNAIRREIDLERVRGGLGLAGLPISGSRP